MSRPIARLPFALLVALAVTATVGLGCASEATAEREARDVREAAREAKPAHVAQARYEDGDNDEMTVAGDEGTMNEADINGALKDHMREIRDCYSLGHRAGARPTGRMLMRFFIDGKGEAYDVGILESTIGNQSVERCIADIGLGVMFERPAGGKPTTFDYPVEFRPARQVTASRQRH